MDRYRSKLELFREFAGRIATLSVCRRTQAGAVIASCDCSEIYAIGYNGPAAGMPNGYCHGPECEGHCGCAHAEANAIAKMKGIKPSIIFITMSPCVYCANTIINCEQIVGVVYDEPYRDLTGLELLNSSRLGDKKSDPIQKWRAYGSERFGIAGAFQYKELISRL